MTFQHVSLQLDENGQPRWANRRVTVRYHCAPATTGKILAADQQHVLRAWILDLSKGGAGLLLPRSLKIGQIITLQIVSPAQGDRREFAARIAHATQQRSGEWMIGCEFLSPLSTDQLDDLL